MLPTFYSEVTRNTSFREPGVPVPVSCPNGYLAYRSLEAPVWLYLPRRLLEEPVIGMLQGDLAGVADKKAFRRRLEPILGLGLELQRTSSFRPDRLILAAPLSSGTGYHEYEVSSAHALGQACNGHASDLVRRLREFGRSPASLCALYKCRPNSEAELRHVISALDDLEIE